MCCCTTPFKTRKKKSREIRNHVQSVKNSCSGRKPRAKGKQRKKSLKILVCNDAKPNEIKTFLLFKLLQGSQVGESYKFREKILFFSFSSLFFVCLSPFVKVAQQIVEGKRENESFPNKNKTRGKKRKKKILFFFCFYHTNPTVV